MLQNRFVEIKESYSAENYKYIHVKTIDNFLFHADSFMNHHKEEIHKTINEYLEIIGSTQINNIADSLQLFNKYIRPLTTLFTDLRGFHMASRLWIKLSWTLLIGILLYLLRASIYFYIVLIVLTIFILARQLYHSRQRKTYGFMH